MNSLTPTFNYVYRFTADEKLCGAPIEKKKSLLVATSVIPERLFDFLRHRKPTCFQKVLIIFIKFVIFNLN